MDAHGIVTLVLFVLVLASVLLLLIKPIGLECTWQDDDGHTLNQDEPQRRLLPAVARSSRSSRCPSMRFVWMQQAASATAVGQQPIPSTISNSGHVSRFEVPSWLPPVLGVLLLWVIGSIGPSVLQRGIVGDDSIKPYSICILFFSLAYVCVCLDATGALAFIALWLLSRVRTKTQFFLMTFLLSSVFTTVTSNDIVILTLTPIILYSCAALRTSPWPFLFIGFFAANLLSIALMVGNPTNIIAAQAFDMGTLEYSKWMVAVALACGLTAALACYLFFRSDLRHDPEMHFPRGVDPKQFLVDFSGAVFYAVVLFACLFLITVGESLPGLKGAELYYYAAAAGGACLIRNLIVFGIQRRIIPVLKLEKLAKLADTANATDARSQILAPGQSPTAPATSSDSLAVRSPPSSAGISVAVVDVESPPAVAASPSPPLSCVPEDEHQSFWKSVWAMPWSIAPFVLGMFILVEALSSHGWLEMFAKGMQSVCNDSVPATLVIVSAITLILCNGLNNQPATILLSRVLTDPAFSEHVSGRTRTTAVLALAAHSNLAANITIIGALAGVMWQSLLRAKGLHISWKRFTTVGTLVTLPTTLAAMVVLGIELAVF